MALPFQLDQTAYDALSDIEKAHYNPLDGQTGKFVLDCPGAVSKQVHDTFRTKNIELTKKVEAYGDITPEVALDLFGKKEEIEAGKSKVGDKVNELVEQRVAAIQATHKTALDAAESKVKQYRSELETRVLDAALIEAGADFGLLPTAHEDITHRGRSMFKLDEDGKTIKAFDADGNPAYTSTGEPMSPKGFIAELAKKATHLFGESSGGGSGGSPQNRNPGGGKSNPWKKESFNLTQQGILMRDNPTEAKTLAAQAGVTL